MIPKAHITAWRQSVPWALDSQVEQDLVISRALVELFSEPFLKKAIAFRGGTALHKLFLHPPKRYSEDIDLVQINAEPIGLILDAVHVMLDSWLGKPQFKKGQGRATLTYRFESENVPVMPLKLKIEINTREHFTVLGFERSTFSLRNPWFSGKSDILTYKPEELLGTKLRALYQRKKGRDLFDLAQALAHITDLDLQKVVDCFIGYIRKENKSVSRAEFEANMAEKINDPIFLADVFPLLAQGISFDPQIAHHEVQLAFIHRLPGKAWKRSNP